MKKTLIAAATLLAAASLAQADEWTSQEGITNSTISSTISLNQQYTSSGDNLTIADGAAIEISENKHLGVPYNSGAKGNITISGGTVKITSGAIQANHFKQTDGDVTVGNTEAANKWSDNSNIGGYYGFELAGGSITVNEGGRLWIGDGNGTPEAMVLSGGRLVLNGTADNQAIVTTMTSGSFNNPDGQKYYQGMILSGTQVDVQGSGLLMSRDVVLDGSNINVADGATLHILSEKELNNDGTPVTSSTSASFNEGTFTMNSGVITLGKGSTLTGRTTAVINGGSVATDAIYLGGTTSAPQTSSAMTFQNMELNGGSVTTDTLTIFTGSSLTYNTQSNALHADKVVAGGSIVFTGVTAADSGKTAADLLGVSANGFQDNNSGKSISIKSQLVDANFKDGKLSVQLKTKDDVLGSTALGESAYADSIYWAYGSSTDLTSDMTGYYLLQAGNALENETAGSDAAKASAAAFDAAIAQSAVRGAAAYTVAADAQRLINAGIEARNMSPIVQGGGVWANVLYANNAADSLYGSSAGYESDIYGGQIGFDWTASCGYRLGGAFSIGTADSNTAGTHITNTDIDTDFYGFSLYASKQIERLTFGLDFGYTKAENDFTSQADGRSFSDSADANIWTVGARANILAWDGDVLDITPHVGIRYIYIDMDDMGITQQEALNAVEMPFGVEFAANFAMAGWTVAPVLDLSIVPQIGDKDVAFTVPNASAVSADVIDGSVFRTKLGVRADYGAFGIGLSYEYGTSSADRDNHALQLNAAYRF